MCTACSTLQCVGVTNYAELFPDTDTSERDMGDYTEDAVLHAFYAGFLEWFQNAPFNDAFKDWDE